jgi:hypothetical protein
VCDKAGGEQFPEISVVAGAGGCDHEDIAGLSLFNGDVKGPIVSRSYLAGQCVAGDMSRSKDGPKARCEKAHSTLGLMDRRHTKRCERVNQLKWGTWRATNYNCHRTPLTYPAFAPSD